MKAKKAKRRELVDMSFDEGLARLIQTKPEEVKPPPGKKRKRAKLKALPSLASPKSKPS
jgi:hypothetical protein